jgi:hypothetical protein
MARASTLTLLSLDQYSALLGINPAHFNQGATATVMPVKNNPCNDIWHQHSWQAYDRVAREDLAYAIHNAEEDIARYLRYWPAPQWVAEEVKPYPRHHRPDVIAAGGLDGRGYWKSINTDFGWVIAPGQRAVTQLPGATVGYSSADGDLINETATVTVPTTLTDECELKVYFSGHGGDQAWEIRPARTSAIALGSFTATFWAWQFIDPDLWEALTTTADPAGIDWSNAANLVATIEVWREFNDNTTRSAEFYWEPRTRALEVLANICSSCGGTGCLACTYTTQDGCLHVRDPQGGMVVPQPATYDDDDSAWELDCFTECRDPDLVKLWYYAGRIDQRNLRDSRCRLLSNWWAQTIAWLATARLERQFCSCANVTALAQDLRRNLALVGANESFLVAEGLLDNPFGTRVGEVRAWQRVSKIAKKRMAAAVI